MAINLILLFRAVKARRSLPWVKPTVPTITTLPLGPRSLKTPKRPDTSHLEHEGVHIQ